MPETVEVKLSEREMEMCNKIKRMAIMIDEGEFDLRIVVVRGGIISCMKVIRKEEKFS